MDTHSSAMVLSHRAGTLAWLATEGRQQITSSWRQLLPIQMGGMYDTCVHVHVRMYRCLLWECGRDKVHICIRTLINILYMYVCIACGTCLSMYLCGIRRCMAMLSMHVFPNLNLQVHHLTTLGHEAVTDVLLALRAIPGRDFIMTHPPLAALAACDDTNFATVVRCCTLLFSRLGNLILVVVVSLSM